MHFTDAEVEALTDIVSNWLGEGFTTPPYWRVLYDILAKLNLQEHDSHGYDTRDPGPGRARDEPNALSRVLPPAEYSRLIDAQHVG